VILCDGVWSFWKVVFVVIDAHFRRYSLQD
jgi:hypothetical protein